MLRVSVRGYRGVSDSVAGTLSRPLLYHLLSAQRPCSKRPRYICRYLNIISGYGSFMEPKKVEHLLSHDLFESVTRG